MPVGDIKVTQNAPCMNRRIQTSAIYYGLELSTFTQCPLDPNSKLTNDPRYI